MDLWSVLKLVWKECCQSDKRYLLLIFIFFLLQLQFFISYLFSQDHNYQHPNSMGLVFSDQTPKSYSSPLPSPSLTAADDNDVVVEILPSFTSDFTDYIFSAMITKDQHSSILPSELSVTIFALSRIALKQGKGVNRIYEKVEENWKKMELSHGTPRGSKKSNTIYCMITNGKDFLPYRVESTYLTTSNMTDDSVNDAIDIIKCKMTIRDIESQLNTLFHSEEKLQVRLYRRGYPTGAEVFLLNFTIPWKTQRTGFMLSPPPHESFEIQQYRHRQRHRRQHQRQYQHNRDKTNPLPFVSNDTALIYSSFNPWEFTAHSTPSFYLSVTMSNDRSSAHLIGAASTPSISSAAYLLEFVYHHILIGFKHIFLSVKYSFGSARMRSLLLILRHAIESGYVTVVSQSADGIDGTSSTHGMTWTENFLKHYHSTMCYYLLKGMNEEFIVEKNNNRQISGAYLMMWDLDSLFIPSYPQNTIQESFLSQLNDESNQNHHQYQHYHQQQPSLHLLRGSPDSQHFQSPLCYSLIANEKIIDKFPPIDNYDDPLFPWLIDRFSQGDSYFLHDMTLENFTIDQKYQIALESIESHGLNGTLFDDYGLLLPINQHLTFASLPTPQYCHHLGLIPSSTFLQSSILYRVMSRKYHFNQQTSLLLSATRNDYSVRFSERVLREIRKYNLDLVILTNLKNENKLIGTKDEHWKKYVQGESSILVL